MRTLAVALAGLGLAFGALAEGSAAAPGASQGDAEARKLLADFFLRTKGMTRVVSASQVWEGMQSGKTKYRVVDVRSPEDFEKGHVPGALNIPLDVLFRTLRIHAHADAQAAHHGVEHRLHRSGEEGPHPRAGAVCACVGSEPGRIVELGVHADRNQVEGGLQVSRPPLDPGHLPRDRRTGQLASREDEARYPHAPRQILGAEGAAVLRSELERRDRPEDRQPGREGRAERPGDGPRGDERDQENPGERTPDRGAHRPVEAIAKGRWGCGGHRGLQWRRSDTGTLDAWEAGARAAGG